VEEPAPNNLAMARGIVFYTHILVKILPPVRKVLGHDTSIWRCVGSPTSAQKFTTYQPLILNKKSVE
jgi:hypothetical protein